MTFGKADRMRPAGRAERNELMQHMDNEPAVWLSTHVLPSKNPAAPPTELMDT